MQLNSLSPFLSFFHHWGASHRRSISLSSVKHRYLCMFVNVFSSSLLRLKFDTMETMDRNYFKEIGRALANTGCLYTTTGVILNYNKTLLISGTIMVISGSLIFIVLDVWSFMMGLKKYKVYIPLASGFLFVFIGWFVTGLLLVACGLVYLVREFWPSIANFFRRLPIIRSLTRLFRGLRNHTSRDERCPV